MRIVFALAALLSVPFLAPSCDKSTSPRKERAPSPDKAVPTEEVATGSEPVDEAPVEAPLRLTESRLQKYIAYRKEFHVLERTFVEEIGKVGKKIEGQSGEIAKSVTAFSGVTKAGEKHDSALKALRAKHGFSEAEDNRLWEAIGDVVGAKASENPSLAEAIKTFREMAAKGGEEKKAAEEFLKNMEETEKQELEKARQEYGAECVEILSKHVKELQELQMDGVKTILGEGDEAR